MVNPERKAVLPSPSHRPKMIPHRCLSSVCEQRQQEARGGNGAAPRAQQAVLTPAFRRRPVDTAEFKQQRAESEAEAERNRQRAGQSASFASLYGTRVRADPCAALRAMRLSRSRGQATHAHTRCCRVPALRDGLPAFVFMCGGRKSRVGKKLNQIKDAQTPC